MVRIVCRPRLDHQDVAATHGLTRSYDRSRYDRFHGIDLLVLPPDTPVHRDLIIALAARYRLPAPKKIRRDVPPLSAARQRHTLGLPKCPVPLSKAERKRFQIQRRCWTRIVCPGRAGIRARLARIATDGHGHPFIERRLWDGGMVSKLSKRFDFKWSRKWVRVI